MIHLNLLQKKLWYVRGSGCVTCQITCFILFLANKYGPQMIAIRKMVQRIANV